MRWLTGGASQGPRESTPEQQGQQTTGVISCWGGERQEEQKPQDILLGEEVMGVGKVGVTLKGMRNPC